MGEVTLSAAWGWLLAACAAIVAIAKAVDVLKGFSNKDFGRKSEEITRKLDNDNKRIQALEEANAVQMKALLALVRHSIDGNNYEGLKSIRDELQDYLIKR